MFTFRLTGIRISATIRLAYIKALFAQPVSVLDKEPPGKATTMITSSANTIQIALSEKLSTFIQAIALVISAYAIAFRYSWALTLVSSSTMLFILLVYGSIVPIVIKLQRSIDKADEKAASVAAQVFGSIRTVISLGAETELTKRYSEWIQTSQERGKKLSPWMGVQLSPTFFAMYCNFALTFWFGLKLYHDGRIDSVSTVVV